MNFEFTSHWTAQLGDNDGSRGDTIRKPSAVKYWPVRCKTGFKLQGPPEVYFLVHI